MLTGFDQAVIAVRDLDDGIDRYRRLLGRAPDWRGEPPAPDATAAAFDLGNARVVLLAASGAGAAAERVRTRLDAQGEGLCGMAFRTADLAAARAGLARAGVVAEEPPADAGPLTGGLALSPEDARGLWTRVVEREGEPRRSVATAVDGGVVALDHIVVHTQDADAAIALYQGRLGIRLALDREFPGRGARLSFFRIGAVTVELAARPGSGQPGADAFGGLAYRVTDADAAHARLSRDGFEVSEVRAGNKRGTQVFTVRDGTCGVPTLVIRDPARER